VRAADACWALTGTALFTKLTAEAGWEGAGYRQWLAEMLTANLLGGPGAGPAVDQAA
jgi:hypothetical protein